MTFIMLIVSFGTRTPIFLWALAMLCDTSLLCTYMIVKAIHP